MLIQAREIDLDALTKTALQAIYRERDRLITDGKRTHALRGDPIEMHLPKRNLKQRLQKVLSSPNRRQLILNLVAILIGRVTLFAYLRVIFTFPAQILSMQRHIESLEFQLADQKVKLLNLSKSLNKN